VADAWREFEFRKLTAADAARRGEGTTLFDWIIEIIERHGPGGSQAADTVVSRLL
jgi:hypothetical protein